MAFSTSISWIITVLLCVFLAETGMGQTHTYTSTFPLTENPLSEGGKWTTPGSSWTKMQTSGGKAYGTQTGLNGYDDSSALLTGTWANHQTITVTVYQDKPQTNGNIYEEVQLGCRGHYDSSGYHGYLIDFRALTDNRLSYQETGWVDGIGVFGGGGHCPGAEICANGTQPSNYGIVTGDKITLSCIGKNISVYKNGKLMSSWTDPDNKFPSGAPSVAWFFQLQGGARCSCRNSDYGYTQVIATDAASKGPILN